MSASLVASHTFTAATLPQVLAEVAGEPTPADRCSECPTPLTDREQQRGTCWLCHRAELLLEDSLGCD